VTSNETMVRMGELAVSRDPGHMLVSLGLGSCIGLALVDSRSGVAGLAHVVLPESDGREDRVERFADKAVPALLAQIERLGAVRPRVKAVLVGGASMFALGSAGLDVGPRNEGAVRDALQALGVPVAAAETGGNRGRTIRVNVESGRVTSRDAGGTENVLFAGDPARIPMGAAA
jgi:chemotaxis protein CheD